MAAAPPPLSLPSSSGGNNEEAVEVPFPTVGQILRHGTHQWKVEKCIYTGPFSDVFVISDTAAASRKYAMKVERVNGIARPVLKLDAHVLPLLKGRAGFPQLVVSGRTASFKYCVMQLVGPDLSKLRKVMPAGKFSLSTALNIANQTLKSLEHLHTSGWLCRDVKAPNLAVGRGTDAATVYMLDFGFARRFLNKDNEYRAQRPTAPLLGTMPYASQAAHCRKEQCPRDDVESWWYMIVEFVMGALPWSYMPKDTILEYKQHIRRAGHREFFARLPPAFAAMLTVIDRTGFYDRPDYDYLRFLLQSAAGTERVNMDAPLDWMANPSLYTKAEKLGEDVTEVPCAAEQSQHSEHGSVRDLAPPAAV